MKLILTLTLALAANAPALADDLGDAYDICNKHKFSSSILGGGQSPWNQGWEHCQRISDEKETRDRTIEARDADLKKTKDVLRQLQGR